MVAFESQLCAVNVIDLGWLIGLVGPLLLVAFTLCNTNDPMRNTSEGFACLRLAGKRIWEQRTGSKELELERRTFHHHAFVSAC